LKAARLTPGGLSKWEILQLIRNGFKAAFENRINRKELLIKAEEEILKILVSNNRAEDVLKPVPKKNSSF
jgi:hypothetical protein